MKASAVLGLLLTCALPTLVQACGDDATRVQRADEAGDAGSADVAGQGSTLPNAGGALPVGEGGASPRGEGGGGGTLASGDAGALATNADAGNGNDSSAGGAACDYADDFLTASQLCSQVRDCYPDL